MAKEYRHCSVVQPQSPRLKDVGTARLNIPLILCKWQNIYLYEDVQVLPFPCNRVTSTGDSSTGWGPHSHLLYELLADAVGSEVLGAP